MNNRREEVKNNRIADLSDHTRGPGFFTVIAGTWCLLVSMIRYQYKNARILFVGINPHFGSFDRGVPFSNNKMFWYLLSDAGILKEERSELRDDHNLRRIYKEKFNVIYRLGFVNIINRPTRDITELKKGEELPGRRRIARIIKTENPPVVCFIGRVAYEKYIGSKDFSFGWQEPINKSRIFVMHFPLRGEAIVRTRELMDLVSVTTRRINPGG